MRQPKWNLPDLTALLAAFMLIAALPAQADLQTLLSADDENTMERLAFEAFGAAAESDEALDVLENAANEFRAKRLTFTTGEWKLSAFYRPLLMEAGTTEGVKVFERWSQRFPNSPAPSVILGLSQLYAQFGSLTSALGQTTHTQSRNVDGQKIGEVIERLNATKDRAANDPYWYIAMAHARLVLDRDDASFKAVIKEGISKEPAFFELYDAAASYFLPKWHGSSEAFENWAREISNSAPQDMKSAVYARMYWHAFRAQYGMTIFQDSQIDWGRFKLGASDYLKRISAPMYWSNFAMIACLAGDHQETRNLLSARGGPPHLDGIYSQVERDACTAWAAKSELQLWIEAAAANVWAFVSALLFEYFQYRLPGLGA